MKDKDKHNSEGEGVVYMRTKMDVVDNDIMIAQVKDVSLRMSREV